MKKSAVIAMLTAFILCLSSCGSGVRGQLTGTWTLTKVNGASLEQYAAAMGREVGDVAVNYTFYEDMVVKKTSDSESEMSVEWQQDGVTAALTEVFVYNEEKDMLVIACGDENVHIYTRGEFNFSMEK